MAHVTAATVAFGAAQVTQLVLGVGVFDCIRTLAYSLPYEEGKVGWDWKMRVLYIVITHRVYLEVLGALLLSLQLRTFYSTSKYREAIIMSGMTTMVAILAALFANAFFVAMQIDQVTLLSPPVTYVR